MVCPFPPCRSSRRRSDRCSWHGGLALGPEAITAAVVAAAAPAAACSKVSRLEVGVDFAALFWTCLFPAGCSWHFQLLAAIYLCLAHITSVHDGDAFFWMAMSLVGREGSTEQPCACCLGVVCSVICILLYRRQFWERFDPSGGACTGPASPVTLAGCGEPEGVSQVRCAH